MMGTSITVSDTTWEGVFDDDEFWYYLRNKVGEMPMVKVQGKKRGENGYKSPCSDNKERGEKVREMLDGKIYLLEFGYKRCALIDPDFPKGILIQNNKDVRIVKWNEYALHGLRSLGMGKKTGGLTRKQASTLTRIVDSPNNKEVQKAFVDIGGLIEKILSCAMSEPLEEEIHDPETGTGSD